MKLARHEINANSPKRTFLVTLINANFKNIIFSDHPFSLKHAAYFTCNAMTVSYFEFLLFSRIIFESRFIFYLTIIIIISFSFHCFLSFSISILFTISISPFPFNFLFNFLLFIIIFISSHH